MGDVVVLTQRGRLLTAAGPNGAPMSPAADAWLTSRLRYTERVYDFEGAAEGGPPFILIPRLLYDVDPQTGLLAFPAGLRSKIATELASAGFTPKVLRPPLKNEGVYSLDWDGLFADFEIYDGQDECLSRLVSCDGGIIAANTGWGKSVILRMLCRLFHKAKIHVVTKMTTLADEIHGDLCKVVPGVGYVGGGKRRFGRVTVFVADSLPHGQGDADILLADEQHELMAPKYAKYLSMYDRARMFGFSATSTGRSDGRDVLGEAIFGPTVYTVTYQDAQAMGRVVPMTVEWLRIPEGPDVSGCKTFVAKERYGIWHNDARNARIADRVNRFGEDEQVMVMVKTIDHAVALKALLPDYTLCYAANGMDANRLAKYIRQSRLPADEPLMTPQRLSDLRKQFAAGTLKKVIANYVWSTGVNFRGLSVLVRADAAASTIRDGQIPGRACRRIPGVKESALLIDCWDEWNSSFLNRSRSRKTNYLSRGWGSTWFAPQLDPRRLPLVPEAAP